MDERKAVTTFKPNWKGVTKLIEKAATSFYSIGYDTETANGSIFYSGFSTKKAISKFYDKNGAHHYFLFLQFLNKFRNFAFPVVCGSHNLKFDMSVLFWPILKFFDFTPDRAPKFSYFSIPFFKCTVKIFWTRPCFGTITFLTGNGKKNKTIHLRDTYAYFIMSLKQALKTFGSGSVVKETKPKGLGKRIIPKREIDSYFDADLKGTCELLEKINELHQNYRIPLTVSLPHMSGYLFRRDFMQKNFVKPNMDVIRAGLLSYHGGKNSLSVGPGWYKDAWALDIRSAFPEAMRQLPDFENGEWKHGKGMSYFAVSDHGIFRISGRARDCPWGSIFSHDFRKLTGAFTGVWVTAYELREALRMGEVRLQDISGWRFEGKPGNQSAFRRFVDYFYAQKETAPDASSRAFYKLVLNSLYGKFIARTENDDGIMQAGSMFDPAIASLITGYVRAKIHGLEHKYNALHTATDGFVTLKKPDPRDLGPGLGQLKEECFGPCLICRNKLYLHYDQNDVLVKRGLHGFEGDADLLLEMYQSKRKLYKIERLNSLAEAWHNQLPPGMPIERERSLNLKEV